MARSGSFRWVYMTTATAAEARQLGEVLVSERLAACVNVLGPITSIYRWKGRVERGREVAFVAKTRAAKVRALAARVKALHTYDVPCIVALPVTGGSADFLRWLADETRGPAPGRQAANPAGARRGGRRGSGSKAAAAPR